MYIYNVRFNYFDIYIYVIFAVYILFSIRNEYITYIHINTNTYIHVNTGITTRDHDNVLQ